VAFEAAQHSRMAISRSLASQNTNAHYFVHDSATSDAKMTIENSVGQYTPNHAVVAQTGGTVSVGGSKFAYNGGCALNNSGGTVFTFTLGGNGTNRGDSNLGGNTCGTVAPAAQF